MDVGTSSQELRVTGLFKQLLKKRTPERESGHVRVWVSGQYVKLTPSQARRYQELSEMDRNR